MIQSRTFIYQLGYGLIKIFVVNLFAELRPLFRQMELSAAQDLHARGQDCIAPLLKLLMPHISSMCDMLHIEHTLQLQWPLLLPTVPSSHTSHCLAAKYGAYHVPDLHI